MLRLASLCAALIIVLSAAIVAVRLIAGAQPNPVVELFTNPDGSPCQMPCLFGVNPGTMTVAEALQVLEEHPLTHGMQAVENGIGVDSQDFAIGISPKDDGRIDYLALERIWPVNPAYSLPGSAPRLEEAVDGASLGNIVLYLGVPRAVEISSQGSPTPILTIRSFYNTTANTTVLMTHTTPYPPNIGNWAQATADTSDELQEMVIYSDDQMTRTLVDRNWESWTGFSSITHYLPALDRP